MRIKNFPTMNIGIQQRRLYFKLPFKIISRIMVIMFLAPWSIALCAKPSKKTHESLHKSMKISWMLLISVPHMFKTTCLCAWIMKRAKFGQCSINRKSICHYILFKLCFWKRGILSWFIINLPLRSQESLLWSYSTSFSSSLQLWDNRKRSSSISSLYNGSLSCKSLKLSLKPECRVSMTYR